MIVVGYDRKIGTQEALGVVGSIGALAGSGRLLHPSDFPYRRVCLFSEAATLLRAFRRQKKPLLFRKEQIGEWTLSCLASNPTSPKLDYVREKVYGFILLFYKAFCGLSVIELSEFFANILNKLMAYAEGYSV
ncbi:MAG: hypothetical protein D6750_01955 [Bacteroidetes bacterium]|nr:MAG: hypothetical protein D6750_01955 [Bacteroidota bacterium]